MFRLHCALMSTVYCGAQSSDGVSWKHFRSILIPTCRCSWMIDCKLFYPQMRSSQSHLMLIANKRDAVADILHSLSRAEQFANTYIVYKWCAAICNIYSPQNIVLWMKWTVQQCALKHTHKHTYIQSYKARQTEIQTVRVSAHICTAYETQLSILFAYMLILLSLS